MGLVLRGCSPGAAEEDNAEPLPGEILGVMLEPRREDEDLTSVLEGLPAGENEGPTLKLPEEADCRVPDGPRVCVLGRNGVLVDLHGVPGQLVVCLREGFAEHLI